MPHSLAITGVSGYGGGEALRLALRHPDLVVTRVFGDSTVGQKLAELYPQWDVPPLTVEAFDPATLDGVDVLFASLPTGKSAGPLAAVPERVKIVDIGGDHRATPGWVYGLADVVPERVRGASRVANPGCYPTAALLALAPLLKGNLLHANAPIVVDGKSGISGAGRGGGATMGYATVNESVAAYKPLAHGHEPEMQRFADDLAGGRAGRVAFVPHLIPLTRGLLCTCYFGTDATGEELTAAAQTLYADSPFVRVSKTPPPTKHAAGSNRAFVHYAAKDGLGVATCAIDNLGKGAAGQALQNANLMLGLDPATGLTDLPPWP
jgi:N-acetyl-gamma-glutamyl-phosphate reductase